MNKRVFELISLEEKRQQETLMLIPSENYVSKDVREALGSVFTNKYSEGYPGKRYYQGNKYADKIETLAIELSKKLFNVPFANVQPHSGCEGNLAILAAICNVGDPILSQLLNMGGHLSMGQAASQTSKYYTPNYYGLTKDGDINWQELEQQAKLHKPKIIFCGGTGFTRVFDFPRYADIAKKVGAYFVADISHIAGLVVGGAHPSPWNSADVIMTTTHKTLRGPRGAMILVTQKGLGKDPLLPEKIDKAVFPGLQGGPHDNNIAALAVALGEASTPEFRRYAKQIVLNSQVMAGAFKNKGFILIGGGSQNHMIWMDLSNKGLDGWTAAWALEAAGMIANRQTIPFDKRPPYYPSGLRLGTPAVTTRGMKEKEMEYIVQLISQVIEHAKTLDIENIGSSNKDKDQSARKSFKENVFKDKTLLSISAKVKKFLEPFPVP